MVVINNPMPDEGTFFPNAMEEVSKGFEEAVSIKRYASVSGGDDAAGTAATVTYTTINTTANVTDLTAQEVAFSNGFYASGDLHIESRIQIFGQENYSGDQKAAGWRPDEVVYRGRTFKVLGHVMPVYEAGYQFYKAVLRQVG